MGKICRQCKKPNRMDAKYCAACGQPEFSLAPGTLLDNGRYEIQKELGRGSYGAVYLARDTRLKSPRVVKEMLVPPQAKIDDIQNLQHTFQREADSLSDLNTPGNAHIPDIVSYFFDSNSHYLVMKYIEGEDLEKRLRNLGGQVNWKVAAAWAIAVADALVYMHSRQPDPVLHRDIKPANILVDTTERVWLVDFGLSKAQPEAGGTIGMSQASGTPGYAPPEQYRQQAVPASDIYALAATVYHLVTGDDPNNHPFSFPSLNQLPDEIRILIMQSLDQEPEKRPSAKSFKSTLENKLNPPTTSSGLHTFVWRDTTVSITLEELALAADRNWEEAKQYLYQHQFKQYFININNNALVNKITQITQQIDDQDEGLEAFLQLPEFNAALPAPTFNVNHAAFNFSLQPDQHKTSRLQIFHKGRGCLSIDIAALAPWCSVNKTHIKLMPGKTETIDFTVAADKIPMTGAVQNTEIELNSRGHQERISIQAEVPTWRMMLYRMAPWADWILVGCIAGGVFLGLLTWLIFWLSTFPTWLLIGGPALVGGIIIANLMDNRAVGFVVGTITVGIASYLVLVLGFQFLADWLRPPVMMAPWGIVLGGGAGIVWYAVEKPPRWNGQGWFALVLGLSLIAGILYIRSSEPAWYYYPFAQQAFQEEKWEEARQRFQAIYENDPDYQDVYDQMLSSAFKAGNQCIDDERWECATVELAFLVQHEPTFQGAAELYVIAQAEPLYQEGIKYLQEESWAEAEARFIDVSRIEPDYKETAVSLTTARAEPIYRQGLSHLETKQWDEAYLAFQTVADLDTNYKAVQQKLIEAQAEPFYLDGIEALENKQWSSAEAAFASILDIDPDYKDASDNLTLAQLERHYWAGQEHLEAEKWTEAADEFRQVLDIDPTYKDASALMITAQAEAAYQLGLSHFTAGDWQESVIAFDEMLAIKPDHKDGAEQREKALENWKSELYDLANQQVLAEDWEQAARHFAQIRTLDTDYLDVAEQITVSPLNDALLAFYETQWLSEEASLHQTLSGHQHDVTVVTFSPSQTILATADSSGQIILWNGATGEELDRLPKQAAAITTLTFMENCSVESADCIELLAVGTETGQMTWWDIDSRKLLKTIDRHDAPITAVAFQSDEQLLATADQSGKAYVWQVPSAEFQYSVDVAESPVTSLAYTHENILAAATEGSGIRIFRHGHGLKSLWHHDNQNNPLPVNQVAFNPDGDLLVSADESGQIWSWHVPSDFLVAPANVEFEPESIVSLKYAPTVLAFSSPGNFLALADDTGVQFWPLTESEDKNWTLTNDFVSTSAFSPFGWLFAVARDSKSVEIWAANTLHQ